MCVRLWISSIDMQLPDAELLCADLVRQLRPHVTPETGMVGIHTGGAWLAERRITTPFVAVAPGSIWGTKRWPGYTELVARLEKPVVVLGSAADGELAAQVAGAAAGRAHSAAGALSLRESAALIERASLLVTNDSAPLHLATGVGTPVVAVFGPTTPSQGFGPLGGAGRVVQTSGLWCRPCSPHGPATCPLGHHACMQSITVDQVLRAATALPTTAAAH